MFFNLFSSGYSTLLRKRYDSLATGSTQLRRRAEEARQRRAEFDGCLETLFPRLQELEDRSGDVEGSRDKISDRLETLRVSEIFFLFLSVIMINFVSCCLSTFFPSPDD